MTDGNLFNTGRRKKRAKPPTDPVVAAALKHLMVHVYVPLYTDRFHEKPEIRPRDWKALKDLLTTHGAELVEQRIRLFVAWDGPGSPMTWERPAGYTIALLQSQWTTLTVILQRQMRVALGGSSAACRHVPRCTTAAEHTRKAIHDAKSRATTLTPSPNGSCPTTSKPNAPC